MDDYDTTLALTTTVLASRADEARGRIDKANRRLARAGVPEYFTWTETKKQVTEKNHLGFPVTVDLVEFTLNRPTLCYEGWEFLAAVDIVEGGVIVNAVPGMDMANVPRPEDHRCDHCQTDRLRKYTYLLRNTESGEIVQVGKTCLELFLGVKPTALWVLRYGIGDLYYGGGAGDGSMSNDTALPIRDVLRVVWSVSEEGTRFISRAVARDREIPATADTVMDVIYGARMSDPRDAAYLADRRQFANTCVSEETVDMLLDLGEDVDGEYGANLRSVLDSEHVGVRHFGLLASVIAVYIRQQEATAKKKAETPVASGFVGEVDEKIADISGEVKVLREVMTDYGYATILIVKADDGHLLKWFGKVPDEVDGQELEVGQRIVITSATVKSHENYQGDDQTRIVRAKLSRPADSASVSAA